MLFVGSNLKKIDVSVRAAACGTASGMKLATARQERGVRPNGPCALHLQGANDARRRSLLRDARETLAAMRCARATSDIELSVRKPPERTLKGIGRKLAAIIKHKYFAASAGLAQPHHRWRP